MLELIAVGFLLSVLTMIMKKNDLNMLDPVGVKLITTYMLAVLMSLVFISNIIRN